MTDLLRAQATFAHRSGLPRDSVSVNLWFWTPDATAASAQAVAERVRDMFLVPVAPVANALGTTHSDQIARTGHSVKVYEYDMTTGERLSYEDAPPLYTLGFSYSGFGGYDNVEQLPSEVSCCLSFRNNSGAVPGGGVFGSPAAQRRGRIYWGPVSIARNTPDAGGVPRPDSTLVDMLLRAAFGLEADNDATAEWVIYSRPFAGRPETPRPGRTTLPNLPARLGQAYIVEQWSVDNAWDTQRRRGEKATVRTFG